MGDSLSHLDDLLLDNSDQNYSTSKTGKYILGNT